MYFIKYYIEQQTISVKCYSAFKIFKEIHSSGLNFESLINKEHSEVIILNKLFCMG